MEVRLIKPEEGVDYLKISAASFIWKFDKEVDKEVEMPVMGAFHDSKLVAGVELFDFKCNYCGNLINTLVLSGVCSKPEQRGMGAVRAIFDEVGRTAVENDITAGFLAPFSIEYYEKFGFANLNRIFTVKVPFSNLRHIPHCNDVELFTGEQLEELCGLHNKCVFTENLMTLREDKKHFCDKPLEEADYTYIHRNADGEADGYVRFKIKRPEELVAEELFVPCSQTIAENCDTEGFLYKKCNGVMGVPISFLEKYCPQQFEVVGMCENLNLYGLKTKIYTAQECKDKYFELFGKKGTYDLNAAGVINGKKTYQRVLIQRKGD